MPGDEANELADGASAGDEEALAGDRSGLADAVDGDGEGLEEGGFAEVHGVGYEMAVFGADLDDFAERAVLGWAAGGGAEVAHVRTEVVASLAAMGAAAAGVGRVDGDAAACGKRIGKGAGVDDFTGGFVAEDKGAFRDEVAVFAVQVVVQVSSGSCRTQSCCSESPPHWHGGALLLCRICYQSTPPPR